jgi:hypothetical protein
VIYQSINKRILIHTHKNILYKNATDNKEKTRRREDMINCKKKMKNNYY